MTPGEEAVSPQTARVRGGGGFTRLAAFGALALVVIAILVLLLSGGGSPNHYRLLFETGGQLVNGNQVLIGGAPVGSVDSIKLTDNGQAQVDISVDRPMHEGTSAIIRATSLSGIANRYVSLQPGPDNNPELQNDAIISEVNTTSPVDLDQLFNTFRGPERQALRNVIQGSATVYAGKGPQANRTYKFLSPSLVATDRLLQELDRDQGTLTNFLVNGASVVSAVANRRADLSALTQNANVALGAIANENQSFDQALVALPGALRQANTTFHNLRPALNDLDPLINATRTSTKNLAPFLRQLHPVLSRSVPVFRDLNRALNLKGKSNDLADATGDLTALENRAAEAVPITVKSMQDSEPILGFLRPYSPDLTAAIAHLNQITAYYDPDGHYARVQPVGLGVFGTAGGPTNFTYTPQNAANVFNDYGPFHGPNYDLFRRCPGGSTPIVLGSNPFANPSPAGVFLGPPNGAPASPTSCNSAQTVPGP
ncbi:MAG: phospholipid/cholesterol/gamma-HCH transport system substrate-binding protein [Solirubrobacterales bacterium]|nr:phospholipid/cholesterol/gamma-HCH transport system substrate-binding protein [Solirubrobacterales bacterium]